MRRFFFACVFVLLAAFHWSASAAEARVVKVLPHLLDAKGRNTLSPSLYERDAYQAFLRQHPNNISAIRFDVQWKAPSSAKNLKLRLDLRGLKGTNLQEKTLENPSIKRGWIENWSSVKLSGADYKKFGEIVAWRATLWDGDQQIAEQKSFMW